MIEETKLAVLQKQCRNYQGVIAELIGDKAELQYQILKLKGELKASETFSTITAHTHPLNNENNRLVMTINGLNVLLQQRDREVGALKQGLIDRDRHVAILLSEVAKLRNGLQENPQSSVAFQNSSQQLEKLRSQLADKTAVIANLTKLIREKDQKYNHKSQVPIPALGVNSDRQPFSPKNLRSKGQAKQKGAWQSNNQNKLLSPTTLDARISSLKHENIKLKQLLESSN